MIALDTNILIYTEITNIDDPRHQIAVALLKKSAFVDAAVPVQVLGEFLNVCIRKLRVAPIAAVEQVEDFLRIFDCPATEPTDLVEAAALVARFKFAFFDAVICTVARRAGATILLSEDMHDGLEVDELKIVNPFAAANETLLTDYFGSLL